MSWQQCALVAAKSYPQHTCGVPWWKRFLDVGCIVLAAPILAPVMILMAVYIKFVSPGGAFFRQERVGIGGRRFTCLKFRTMKEGAPTKKHEAHLKDLIHSDKPMTKMDKMGDPRVIPGGAFLRSTGLDELPQIINVIRGEMSLVGPRPCTTFEFEQLEQRHLGRFETLPGLTGLWQVSGKNATTFEQMIEMDTRYAREKTPWLDLWIMAKTPAVLAKQLMEVISRRN